MYPQSQTFSATLKERYYYNHSFTIPMRRFEKHYSLLTKLLCGGLAILIFHIGALAQTHKIEILRQRVLHASNNFQKLEALRNFCEEANSMNIDSLFLYADSYRKLALEVNNPAEIVLSHIFLETWLVRENLLDSALHLCNEDLQHINYESPLEIFARTSRQKAYVLMRLNKRQETLAYTYHFLNQAESRQDTLSQVYCKYIIGCVYRSMQQTEQALGWFQKAALTGSATIYDEQKNDFAVYLQIGGMYNWKAVSDSLQKDITADSGLSINYLDKAIAFSRRDENIAILARALCMKADAMEDPLHIMLAGNYLKEAIKIYNSLHDTLSILNGITAMSDYYLSSGQPEKGIASCQQGIAIVKRGFSYPITELYWTLAQCYRKAGDNARYAETLNSIIDLNNATYKKNSEQDLAELNAKYELSNKEAFIARQKLELLRKDIWMGITALLILLAATAAYLLYRRNRRKQILAFAAAEEKERRRIAADLHDNIGAHASAISAGIDELESRNLIADASSIQYLKNNATEIIASLRDTIWAFNKDSISLTGISDRLKTYIQKLQPAFPQVSIDLAENISVARDFSPVHALHILRIVQEGLHNALRHSHCSQILVSIAGGSESISVLIEDNGDGFDPELKINEGNGLFNMKTRASEAGFLFTLTRRNPKGTRIELSLVSRKK